MAKNKDKKKAKKAPKVVKEKTMSSDGSAYLPKK
jgi:hypothetical protein